MRPISILMVRITPNQTGSNPAAVMIGSKIGLVIRMMAAGGMKKPQTSRNMKRDELLDKLEAQQVPAGPINNLEQVFNDPQVAHRGMKLALKSKAAKAGTIPGVRTPIVIDGWRAASERPSPLLGEHTAEILREIGEA